MNYPFKKGPVVLPFLKVIAPQKMLILSLFTHPKIIPSCFSSPYSEWYGIEQLGHSARYLPLWSMQEFGMTQRQINNVRLLILTILLKHMYIRCLKTPQPILSLFTNVDLRGCSFSGYGYWSRIWDHLSQVLVGMKEEVLPFYYSAHVIALYICRPF